MINKKKFLGKHPGELGVKDAIHMWYEWANESGYEFDNHGSECCPEYAYPDDVPFEWV